MVVAARLVTSWLARSAVLFLLWLALVDNVHSVELYAGAACAVLAGAAGAAARRLRRFEVRVEPWMLRRAHRQLVSLVTDTLRVALVVARAIAGRRPTGRLRAVRTGATGPGADDAARRALNETLGSLGPNRYVIGIDRESGAMLVHELLPDERPLDALELG